MLHLATATTFGISRLLPSISIGCVSIGVCCESVCKLWRNILLCEALGMSMAIQFDKASVVVSG